jgi:hypothetical protein
MPVETMIAMRRSYADLSRLETFEERYRYLALSGSVGQATFGFDRYLNQKFYSSKQWRDIRHAVIVRDDGCDLGVEGYDIHDRIYIHHLNPMTVADIERGNDSILDLDNLIAVTHQTHNAIHYGDETKIRRPFVERSPGDTKLW